MASPALKGDVGAAEPGLRLKPSAGSKLSADLGLEGHVDQRLGVAGGATPKRDF
ncbi:MAG: hypothetical protein LBU12_04800 [Deltaproteobacteria bacterium]|nr:hypothetical protein [Deltaproteobacteria bacterium]